MYYVRAICDEMATVGGYLRLTRVFSCEDETGKFSLYNRLLYMFFAEESERTFFPYACQLRATRRPLFDVLLHAQAQTGLRVAAKTT